MILKILLFQGPINSNSRLLFYEAFPSLTETVDDASVDDTMIDEE